VGIEATTFGILAQTSYSPEYITPTQKKKVKTYIYSEYLINWGYSNNI
jgi:hypothetical protein